MFVLAFVRPRYFLLVFTPVAFLVPIELYVIFTLKSLIHEGVINSILSTSLNESIEAAMSNIFPIFIFIILFSLYITLLFKVKNTFILSEKNKRRLLFLSCIIQMLVVSREIYRLEVQSGNVPFMDKIDDIVYMYRIKMLKTFPASWIVNLYLYRDSINSLLDYEDKIKGFTFGAKEVSNKNEKKL
jgi:glucan phosphoethanolaminetransferase (alkaline phosphatase superfamily)